MLQFAQFALLTQTMALFIVYCLDVVGSRPVIVIVSGQLVGDVVEVPFSFSRAVQRMPV